MKHLVDHKLDSFIGEINSMTDQLARVSLTATPSISTCVQANLGPVQNIQHRAIHRTTSAPYFVTSPVEEPASSNSRNAKPRSKLRQIPITGIHIPDIGRGCGGWHKAIEQWEHGTPNMPQGLALKDWPKEWHTKSMAAVMGIKHSQLKLVADEYASFERDDKKFLNAYPFADTKSLADLLNAIGKNRPDRQRNSRNGTPSERDSSPDGI
ncbi:hypothetical protein L208DRAFT_1383025 [Tricholoma matsutake]|nr:hypothetical protein L208DRAFT_1383025 [Tricholoma matsutake 945]